MELIGLKFQGTQWSLGGTTETASESVV